MSTSVSPSVATSVDPSTWRRLGLIGGTSWVSSEHYYRLLNAGVAARAGGNHSAPMTLWSVEFGEMARLQHDGDWPGVGRVLANAASRLIDAGCHGIALAANTTHLAVDDVQAVLGGADFIDIRSAVAGAAASYRRIGLLGTGFTMASPMYPDFLAADGIEVIVPGPADQQRVHDIVYDELTRDIVTPESQQYYRDVVAKLVADGAEAVALACTEQNLLLHDGDGPVPFIDTTAVHCAALIDYMLGGAA